MSVYELRIAFTVSIDIIGAVKNKNARSRIIKPSTDATSVCRERIKPL